MNILYKRYFNPWRLLRSSDVENSEQRISRRSCRVRYYPGLLENLSDLSLAARVEMCFLFSSLFQTLHFRDHSIGFWLTCTVAQRRG